MTELLRFKDFQKSELDWLRSERLRLLAQVDMLDFMLDASIDEAVDLKCSLEEATGIAQE